MCELRYNKKLYYSIMCINLLAIFVYNLLTPPMSDDLYWHPGEYASMSEILHDTWLYYNNWLGRVESYFFTRVSDAYPKGFYNVVSSFFFVALILALYFNIEKDEKYDCRTLSLLALYIWIWGIDFAQTILWVCGTCNYLWCLAIEFGFLAYYRYMLKKDTGEHSLTKGKNVLQMTVIFMWGLLAGNGNEGSSGALVLLLIYFTLKKCFETTDDSEKMMIRIRKYLDGFKISGIMGVCLGFAVMLFAPGNRIRGAVSGSDENQTGLLLYLGRFIKINDIVFEYMSLLIIVIVILLVYMHKQKGKTFRDLADIYAYIVIAAISIYVIILTTIPMPRAFMGGSLILLIACMQLIQYLDKKDRILDTIATGAVILMTLFMMRSYVKNAANLVRILRELEIRQEYVDEQKAEGKDTLVLPMLRPEWDNRYTYIYHNNDINEEQGSFGNEIYGVYYRLKEVTGIPWEEWEATRQE